jgi:hypothetical protein
MHGSSSPREVYALFASHPPAAVRKHGDPADVVGDHASLPHSPATDTSESNKRDSKRRGPISPVHVGLERRGVPSAAWDSGRWGSGGVVAAHATVNAAR